MTELDVGSLIERAYHDPAVDKAGGTGSQLRILGAAAHGEQATVNFLLQDGAGPPTNLFGKGKPGCPEKGPERSWRDELHT